MDTTLHQTPTTGGAPVAAPPMDAVQTLLVAQLEAALKENARLSGMLQHGTPAPPTLAPAPAAEAADDRTVWERLVGMGGSGSQRARNPATTYEV